MHELSRLRRAWDSAVEANVRHPGASPGHRRTVEAGMSSLERVRGITAPFPAALCGAASLLDIHLSYCYNLRWLSPMWSERLTWIRGTVTEVVNALLYSCLSVF